MRFDVGPKTINVRVTADEPNHLLDIIGHTIGIDQ
jgi:hypothetical protein